MKIDKQFNRRTNLIEEQNEKFKTDRNKKKRS